MEMREKLQEVNQQIQKSCDKYNIDVNTVKLLAVSKGQPSYKIKELYKLGIRDFGENYAQELEKKATELADFAINWHYIGHLQSNKIAKLVEHCSHIHSVAKLQHAEAIQKYALKLGKSPFPIYINVNTAKEPNKHGCSMDEARELNLGISKKLPYLKIKGIMVIPPKELIYDDNDNVLEGVPDLYKQIRSLANKIGEGQLSMGMSADLSQAIGAGSNMVRIGTALFGPRT